MDSLNINSYNPEKDLNISVFVGESLNMPIFSGEPLEPSTLIDASALLENKDDLLCQITI